jgi:hypothetical protein
MFSVIKLLGHSAARANFVGEHSRAIAPARFIRKVWFNTPPQRRKFGIKSAGIINFLTR